MSSPQPPSAGDAGRRRPARVFATTLATVTGNLYLVVATLAFGSLAAVVGWLPPRGDWMFRLARWWSRGWLATAGVRLDASYAEPLDPQQGYVFMANHQSYFDIPTLISTLPGQTRFLAKRGLFQIPVFGWSLHAGGFVPVDRADRTSGRRTFQAAMERLASGRSILVFPEETRSRDGGLLPFKRGGFLMAIKSGYPLVPVGIRGTLEVQPRDSARVRPGRVTVRYGRPIAVARYGLPGRAELAAEVRREIECLCAPAP